MPVIGAFMVPHPPLIIPSVGRGDEEKISKTVKAYEEAGRRTAELHPDTVVISTPHSVMYADYFHISPGDFAEGDFRSFRAPKPKITVKYDSEFVRALSGLASRNQFPAGTKGERDPSLDHATMIPLYFLQKYQTDFSVVRVGLSGLSPDRHYELGMMIKKVSDELDRKVVFIASGDLSHRLKEDGPYGFAKEGPVYDEKIMKDMSTGDFGALLSYDEQFCEKAGECGQRSFTILAGALDRTAVKAEKLSYEGPFGVGYGICAFSVEGTDPARNFLDQYREKEKKSVDEERSSEDAYVSLARITIESYIRNGKKPDLPDNLPKEMLSDRAGVFVSIHEHGRLRGCIGTISACENCIANEIIQNAVSASTRDPRFDPVTRDELSSLSISVDVLGDAEDIDGPEDLDVKKYGVIVSRGFKRGLLLPNLDGVDTVSEQLSIAKRKAGIKEDEQDVELKRFEVVRHF